MSNRSYPRYHGKIRLEGRERERAASGSLKCACYCEKPVIGYADVQYSWFRSDDTGYPVCEEHRKLASSNVKRFLDLLNNVAPAASASVCEHEWKEVVTVGTLKYGERLQICTKCHKERVALRATQVNPHAAIGQLAGQSS